MKIKDNVILEKRKLSLLKALEDEIRFMKPHKKSDLSIDGGSLISKKEVIELIERFKQ